MLTVEFGNFAKRKNSTARPTTLGVSVAVALKENTSFDNPVFKLTMASFDYNYCKWGDRYYFVVDVISERNNGWSVVCELDLMATYRDAIHGTTAFIEYATQGNNQIVDPRLGVEYGVTGVNSEVAGGAIPYMDVDINDAGFFITVVGQTSTETYYISAQALESLFYTIATWTDSIINVNNIDTTSVETAIGSTMELLAQGFKQLIASGNASDCVRDAYCLPIVAPTDVLAAAAPLKLGMFDTGLVANRILGAGNTQRTVTINIPHQYSDWRRQSPYEVCQLFLPLYGTINIPSDIAADSTSLTVKAILNVRSGDFTYYISGNGRGGKEIVVGGNCCAPLAIGASNINMMQAVSAGISMGTNVVYGNAAGAAQSLLGIAPAPYSIGQTGGISNRDPRLECYVYYRTLSDNPATIAPAQGIPFQATRQLGTMSGYVQTVGASVSGTLHGEQFDKVNAILDAGAFIE